MPTIANGNTAEVYVPLAQSVTFTPGSGGAIEFGCSSPSGNDNPDARMLYAETVISIPAGSTFFARAINADASYTEPAFAAAQVAALGAVVSEAWMSDAIVALIGYHPTRVYLDSQPLWLDNSPVLS